MHASRRCFSYEGALCRCGPGPSVHSGEQQQNCIQLYSVAGSRPSSWAPNEFSLKPWLGDDRSLGASAPPSPSSPSPPGMARRPAASASPPAWRQGGPAGPSGPPCRPSCPSCRRAWPPPWPCPQERSSRRRSPQTGEPCRHPLVFFFPPLFFWAFENP